MYWCSRCSTRFEVTMPSSTQATRSGQTWQMTSTSLANCSMSSVKTLLWKVASVAKMATLDECVALVAGFTPGTTPTNGTENVARRVLSEVLDAELHATTTSLACR